MHARALGPATPAFPRAMLGNRVFAGAIPAALLRGADDYLPRALLDPRVRAAAGDPNPNQILRDLTAAFETWKVEHGADVDKLAAATDDMAIKLAALQMGAGGSLIAGDLHRDPAYSKLFAGWMRNGHQEGEVKQQQAVGERIAIRAAMSESNTQNGGFLVPLEWDGKVGKAQTSVSPMRQIAAVKQTSTAGYITLWSYGGWGSGWVGETASRPNTTTPNLASVIYAAGQIYARPSITQDLLDDAGFDFEAWVTNELANEFTKQEGIAFISGNGVNKPQGLLSYADPGLHPGGALGITLSGDANKATADSIIDLVYSLGAPYRQNARFLMNSLTAGSLRKFKDTTGAFIWQQNYAAGEPPTLAGYPVSIDEGMPNVAAGAYPIAFGDFQQGYIINDRIGISVLRDPYTSPPYVNFYARKRVGGGISDPNAIRLLKVGTA